MARNKGESKREYAARKSGGILDYKTGKVSRPVPKIPVSSIPKSAKVIDESTYLAIPKSVRPTNVIVTKKTPSEVAQTSQRAKDVAAYDKNYVKSVVAPSLTAARTDRKEKQYDKMDLGLRGVVRKIANTGPSTKGAVQGTTNFLKSLVAGAARMPVTIPTKALLTFTGKDKFTPENRLEKFLVGSDGVSSYSKDATDIQKWAKEKGLTPAQAAAVGIAGGIGEVGLDFAFGGKGGIYKQIAKSTDRKFIESALKGSVNKDVLPSLTKELASLTKASEVKAAVESAKAGVFVPKGVLERRATRMHPEDVKLMERVINEARMNNEITPSVRTESTYLAQHLGINPEQTDKKLANSFETFIESHPKLKSRFTGLPVKRTTLPGFIRIPGVKEPSVDTINRQLEHVSAGSRRMQAKLNASTPEYQRRKAIFDASMAEKRGKQTKLFVEQIRQSRNVQDTMSKVAARDSMKAWRAETIAAKESAHASSIESATRIKNDGLELIMKHQSGARYEGRATVEKIFADLKTKAEKAGFEFGTKEHYIPQIYKNSSEEVKTAMATFMKDRGVDEQVISDYVNGIAKLSDAQSKSLGVNPSFTKEATFPSYDVAMRYGLKPKYERISQLVGAYNERLNTAIANKNLIERLVKNKEITAVKEPGMIAVNIPVQGEYYANPKTAKFINDIFRNEDALNGVEKFFKYGSKLSRSLQELILSGGVPKTNVNFFTFGHVIKSLTTGIGNVALLDFRGAGSNFKAIANVVRSNFTKPSIAWFAKKQPIIQKMAGEGIDMTSRIGNYKEVNRGFEDFFRKSSVKEIVGDGFDRLFNEKTFNSFLPMQQVSIFEGTYKSALKKGLSEAEASKLAGATTKKFMGLSDSMRGVTAQEAINTTFFAPHFREGLINTYWNTVKSLNPRAWKDMSYHQNRALLAGIAMTFAGYNLYNRKLTGHDMWDNPSGHKMELMIPGKEGKVFFVPFMPSQLAFFRANIEGGLALASGDIKTSVQKFGSNLSMGIHLVTDILGNKDYFGNEIYDEQADGKTQLRQVAKYVGLSYNHPFVKGAVQFIQDRMASRNPIYPTYMKITGLLNEGKRDEADRILGILSEDEKKAYYEMKAKKLLPVWQIVSQMFELPIKFSTVGKIENQRYYENRDNTIKELKSISDETMRSERLQEILSAIPDQGERSKMAYALSQNGISTEGISISDAMIRMKPTYDKVQSLVKSGNIGEATKITQSMSEQDYKDYKKVRSSERAKRSKRTRELLDLDPVKAVEYVRSLDPEEQRRIVENLTKEEYAVYKTGKR